MPGPERALRVARLAVASRWLRPGSRLARAGNAIPGEAPRDGAALRATAFDPRIVRAAVRVATVGRARARSPQALLIVSTRMVATFPIVIEEMTLDDVDGVQEVERASFPVPWPANAFRHELTQNKNARYLVAREGG